MGKTVVNNRRGIQPIHMIFVFFILVELVAWFFFKNFIFNYDDPQPGEVSRNLQSIAMVVAMVYVPYMLPAFIGRNSKDAWKILFANFFLGWTLLGWLYAFTSSLMEPLEKWSAKGKT